MSKITYIKPRSEQQLKKFHTIVTADKSQKNYAHQVHEWNIYAYHAHWYKNSPAAHKSHIKSSIKWQKDIRNSNKTKYYRLHSYFRNFTTKKAFIPDLEDEKHWLEERRVNLSGQRYQSTPKAHRLPRGSSKTFTYTSDPRSSRLHRSYRSYAHHYIAIISSEQDWERAMALVEKSFKKQAKK